ncbi:hypothetical protein FOFC_13660, partial [Fusarium oxysporum]
TCDFLVEKQPEWAAQLKPLAVETNKEWLIYVILDCPKRLTDLHGNELDSDIVNNEIEIQTGLKPAEMRPSQRETCWSYHFARNCHRRPVCQRCGKTGHPTDDY